MFLLFGGFFFRYFFVDLRKKWGKKKEAQEKTNENPWENWIVRFFLFG